MESLFKEIFSIEGVQGALFITDNGVSQFSKFVSPLSEKIGNKNFSEYLKNSINLEALKGAFDNTNESLLIFEKIRLYIKKTENGFLIIVMGIFVPVAMVRLNCQIIIPELNKMKKQKGLGRFFKK